MRGSPEERRGVRPGWVALALSLGIAAALVLWIVRAGGDPPPGAAATSAPPPGPSAVPSGTPTCGPVPPLPDSPPRFETAPQPDGQTRQRWRATVRTTCGEIAMVLDGRVAPRAVASFVELARSGYWTHAPCDRLTTRLSPVSVLQCGNPVDRRSRFVGYTLSTENPPPGLLMRAGTVAMVTPGWDPERQQEFVIAYRDFTIAPPLEPPAVIGHVETGLEVVLHIARGGGEDGMSDWAPFINVSVLSVDVVPLPR